MEKYDRRKGWRGPLLNKKNIAQWNNNLKKYKLEKTIAWDLAIVKKINKFSVEIETEKKKQGVIKYDDASWTKKELDKIFKLGDIVYVKNIKDNFYSLKQVPKANGGIVFLNALPLLQSRHSPANESSKPPLFLHRILKQMCPHFCS